ncbi:unnamed protein product [Linum trigynum]|uniref:Uncharacterized protein n=1 Tax=Linum trigynum TaxID=586398 RepID=A0AAV2E755_9ROSI
MKLERPSLSHILGQHSLHGHCMGPYVPLAHHFPLRKNYLVLKACFIKAIKQLRDNLPGGVFRLQVSTFHQRFFDEIIAVTQPASVEDGLRDELQEAIISNW